MMPEYTKEVIKRLNGNIGRNKYWIIWIKQTDMENGYFEYEVYYKIKKQGEVEVRKFWIKSQERNRR